MNFQGFYTVLLEKNDELISTATVRIYGKKVAEVPLVATRFQYRRLGMCRVLMNELEKKLMEFGVEKLVLPAVPSVLNTWTSSFGFSVMDKSQRLNLLENIFLDFQGTVSCQKILLNNPSTVSSPSKGTLAICSNHVDKNPNIEFDGNSIVSEVFQVDHTREADISKHGSTSIATSADNENGNCSPEFAIMINRNQSTLPGSSACPTMISLDCPAGIPCDNKAEGNKSRGVLKCYKRRRVSSC